MKNLNISNTAQINQTSIDKTIELL